MSGEIANVVDFEAGPPLVGKFSVSIGRREVTEWSVHAHFTPDAISARQAAITSLHSFKLPATASEQQKSALEDSFLHLAKFCATQTSCTGYACGWGEYYEDLGYWKVTDKTTSSGTTSGRGRTQ
jgi:hypothetical protein